MKKLLLILAVATSMSLASCGNKSQNQGENVIVDSTYTDAPQTQATNDDDAANQAADGVVTELKAGETVSPESLPVVVDFNATWCGPCKAFAPTFHEVAAEYADKAKFASADVDVCKELAQENNVTSIPNVTIFYPAASGRQAVSHEGRMTKEEFKAFLDKNL